MSDLSDELRQVAADGASQAIPLAVADVIRRGNRRRRRTIAQRSIGGLSAAGLSAVAIFTGATGHPQAPASSTAGGGLTTFTETASSSAGKITVNVKFQGPGAKRVRIISLTYSGSSHVKIRHPVLIFSLSTLPRTNIGWSSAIDPANSRSNMVSAGKGRPANLFIVITLKRSELGHFSGSVHVRQFNRVKSLLNSTLTAALADVTHSKKNYNARIYLQDGLILG